MKSICSNKLELIRCSLFIAICLLFFACSTKKDPTEDTHKSELINFAYLSKNYKPTSSTYLSQLNERISNSFRTYREKGCPTGKKIYLITDKRPIAITDESRTIFISSGMIRNLNTEAELAFILSHENAHQFLCHSANKHDLKEQELEADILAADILKTSGYNPWSGYNALNRLYSLQNNQKFISNHPNLSERIDNLNSLKIQYTRFSGTELNRNFNKFKHQLIAAS